MSIVDLTNKRFGRLLVLSRAHNDKYGNAQWKCLCDCGRVKIINGTGLRRGAVVSCGCYHRDDLRARLTTHGLSNTRIRNIWNHMVQRCHNPNDDAYRYYGGRGISVCDDWRSSFVSFYEWAINNGYSESLTIDRIDTNGNYEPSNCRWVSRSRQMNNTRRCHLYEINGETKTISEWCKIFNVPYERTRRRVVNEGMNIIDAINTPKLNRNREPILE